MRLIFKTFSMALLGAATPLAAMAHSGHDGVATGGLFTQGILHPLLGMDHLLAMIAVGLMGAIAGGGLSGRCLAPFWPRWWRARSLA